MLKKFFCWLLILGIWKTVTVSANSASENINGGIQNITVKLGKQLLQNNAGKNIIFSPYNIYNALVLLQTASETDTLTELNAALGFSSDSPFTNDEIHSALKNLSQTLKLTSGKGDGELSIATGIFIRNGLNVKSEYKHQLETNFDAEVSNVDFSSSTTTDEINKWVSNKTKAHIPILFPTQIPSDVDLLLPNVLYFDAIWKHRFQNQFIANDIFKVSPDQSVNVTMMSNLQIVPYHNNENKKYEVVGLPYEGQEYCMYFILPYQNNSLSSLLDSLTAEDYQKLVQQADENREFVLYRIPNTKLSWSGNVKEELKNMGVTSIFDKPDFSNMINEAVKVSSVLHATDITINESGTTASAVTVPVITVRSGLLPWGEPIKVSFNRPFSFLLYHLKTNTIMFQGIVFNPLE